MSIVDGEALKVGRGGWYACNVCSSRHTLTSKTGRRHQTVSAIVAQGEAFYLARRQYLTPSERRLGDGVFALREAVSRGAGIPEVFLQAFRSDQ